MSVVLGLRNPGNDGDLAERPHWDGLVSLYAEATVSPVGGGGRRGLCFVLRRGGDVGFSAFFFFICIIGQRPRN